MTNPNLINTIFVWPVLNLLIATYHWVDGLHIPFALGFAIILMTIIIKIVLYPLNRAQIQYAKKMQELAPHLKKLREKHKNNTQMYLQEQQKLFKEYEVSQAAGCLPMLIQMPIILSLLNVFRYMVGTKPAVIMTEINKIVYFPSLKLIHPIDENFFGLPLGKSPQSLLGHYSVLILLIPIVTILFQLIQSKMMVPLPAEKKEIEEKGSTEEDVTSTVQSQMLYFLPLVVGFSSFTFPVGLSLYWNIFTIFGIIQQYQVQGLGGLQSWIDKLKRK